jgi:probable phosphoglycerate mutase
MIEPTRIFALRHGETAWNVGQRIQGQLDVPLNERGHLQAQRLAQALTGEGLAAIYTSDLQRARATAQAVADACTLALMEDAALRERGFGRFEGQTYADIEARWPDDALRWRRREIDFAPGGGETLREFSTRSIAALKRIALAHPAEAVAVVAHGGVLDCLYRCAAGMALDAPRTWQLGNASINRVLFAGEGFVVIGWDDHAHLSGLDDGSA